MFTHVCRVTVWNSLIGFLINNYIYIDILNDETIQKVIFFVFFYWFFED